MSKHSVDFTIFVQIPEAAHIRRLCQCLTAILRPIQRFHSLPVVNLLEYLKHYVKSFLLSHVVSRCRKFLSETNMLYIVCRVTVAFCANKD